MEETAVKVAVRVRPLLSKEILHNQQVCVRLVPNTQQIIIGKDRVFTFDYVFGKESTQDDVYITCIKPLVVSLVEGYNATVFAYGQTGSGKTYTIGGGHIASVAEDEKGIIPHAIQDLFESISENHNIDFSVKVSYIEVYKEDLRDLLELETSMKDLHIREDEKGNTGAKECQVESAEEVMSLLEIGNAARHTGTTQMNEHSSRSHAIFTISICQQRPKQSQNSPDTAQDSDPRAVQMIFSKFHFVDLAGSERVTKTGNTGERFKESIQINSGLLALGNVISALGDPKRKSAHVPYRDAKITRILKDSLGGNAKTVMITCISPSSSDFDESLNSLKYANRARNIRNKPIVNYNPDWDRIDEMEHEIKALREALKNQRSSVMARVSQVSQEWGQDKTQIRSLEEQLAQLQTECFNQRNCIEEAFTFITDVKDTCTLTKSKQLKLQDWLNMVEGLRNEIPNISGVNNPTGSGRDEPHHITILQLKRELKKCQDALAADEEVFSQKEQERKDLLDQIQALIHENQEQQLSLEEAEQTNRLQNEKMVEQHLLINQLQDKLEKMTFVMASAHGEGDGPTPVPCNRRPYSVPLTNTSQPFSFSLVQSNHLSDRPEPRKVHTSPPTYSLERVVAGFRTRSQMLLGNIEEKDEVLHCQFSDHSDEEDGEENKENRNKLTFRRSINRTWTRKQAPITSVVELQNHQHQMPKHTLQNYSIPEAETTDAEIEILRESQLLNMKKLKNSELRLAGAKQKVRELAINIKMKEELINELVKTGNDAQTVNQQYSVKISHLEQEAEQAKTELAETQALLQELESKEIRDAAQKAKLQREFRKKMDAAKLKVQMLNKKHQDTKKLASLSTQNVKRVTELEQNVDHMRQQQTQLQKKLREEADKKRKLESEIQQNQQQIKELQLKTEQQQKILKLKTEEIAAIRKRKSIVGTPDQFQKLEEQKKWLDDEVERVLQQRQALEELEEDLKKREAILSKKETLQLEKSHLEIKKLRSSQALNKDILKLSSRLSVVEKELTNKSTQLQGRATDQERKISEEVQSLQKERDHLLKRRDSMDEKLKHGRVLSPDEEHVLFQLEEAIEALEAAIDYKNENINSRQSSINDTTQTLRQSEANVMEKLSSLSPSEIRSLLIRYFNKVVGLRESERKLHLRSEEMCMRVVEQENIVRELESALAHLNMQCDRRLTLQQKEHEQKTQLLLLHFKDQDKDGITESINAYETKVQQLEKDLFFYKKTSRELKKKLRELIGESLHPQPPNSKNTGTSGGIQNQDDIGPVSEDFKWTSNTESSKMNGRSKDRENVNLDSSSKVQLNSFRLLGDISEPAQPPLSVIPIRRRFSSGEDQVEDEELSSLKPQNQLFIQLQTQEGILPVQKGTPVKVSRRELRQISPLELSMRRSSIGTSVGSIPVDSIEIARRSNDFKL